MSLAPLAWLAIAAAIQLPQGPPQKGQGRAKLTEPPPIEDRSTPLPPPRPAEPRPITDVLALGPIPMARRSPVVLDPWRARLVRGSAATPEAGAEVALPDGAALAWKALEAKDGTFEDAALRGGWAHARVVHPEKEVQLLELRGPSDLVVNGRARGGDPYETGLIRIPFVTGPEGTDVFFHCERGRLSANVQNPPARIYIEDRDATLPDMLRGRLEQMPGSVTIVNATDQEQLEVLVTCTAEFFSGSERASQQYLSTVRVQRMFPLEIRKLTVPLPLFFEFDTGMEMDEFTLIVSLHQVDQAANMQISLSQVRFPIRVRDPNQTYRTTYTSHVDDSAQYYSVLQASSESQGSAPRGLVLSLHGAGVEAQAQADSYTAKDWCHIVAPTNRRPYGFDWEDWGRLDALDVLADASERLKTDPARTCLTGHSMGGHGTWLLGALNSNTFAAVAPIAGWSDFWSYGKAWTPAEGNDVEALLARAANASRTQLVLENLKGRGIYVLHGDADDNVPVTEARALRDRLKELGAAVTYEERPGAGHWTGNDAVDWPPVFDFLAAQRMPEDAGVLDLRFATVNPALSARLHWLEVQGQHRSLEPTVVEAKLDPAARRFDVSAQNLSRLSLDLGLLSAASETSPATLAAGEPVHIAIDGQTLDVAWPHSGSVVLFQIAPDEPWTEIPAVPDLYKGPLRAGPFKEALRNKLVFVYATNGTPEENEWSRRRAQLDLDVWRARGNGRADLWSDADFLTTQPHWRGERSIVIYGHADMNKAWSLLAMPCPIEARRGKLRVGERTLERDDLALLLCFPRTESKYVTAAVVCGTGEVGARLTESLPYFVSGVAYPDWTVFAPEMLEQGSAGVLGTGFFGFDWTLTRGQEAWQDKP